MKSVVYSLGVYLNFTSKLIGIISGACFKLKRHLKYYNDSYFVKHSNFINIIGALHSFKFY